VSIQRQQMANEAYAQRETLKYGGAMPQQDQGGGQQQGGASEQDANAILSETVAMLKVNPTEDPKAVLQRIVSLGNDPARLNAANQYSDEQKQMIMRAAQIIRQYQNK
jgi:3-methyladenine DNA glycosylase/8-oxoguanine DNA glycosylase